MRILSICKTPSVLPQGGKTAPSRREPNPLCRCATSLPEGETSWIARKAKKRQNRSFSDSDVFCIFPKLLVRVLDGGDAVCTCGDDEVGAVEEEAGLQNTEGALEECFHGCIVLTKL